MLLQMVATFTGSVKNKSAILSYATGNLSGLKFAFSCWSMKKKENLWELLKRLDEEAGQYNFHLNEANRYFDNTALATKKLLEKHEKRLHKLIGKVQKSIKAFQKKKGKE